MKVTVFGAGYVGLVTAVCLAEFGNYVMCVDIDLHKVDLLKRGVLTLHEPGLQQLLLRHLDSKRLQFSGNPVNGVMHSDILIVAVGTPANSDGSTKTQDVLQVAKTIGKYMENFKAVVIKSTVPVGTGEIVHQTLVETLKLRLNVCGSITFSVISNPEFLKEGTAIADFNRPDRIIIGSASCEQAKRALCLLELLYEPFKSVPKLYMDIKSAELTKYAANAMLAVRISFMNEVSHLAQYYGADIEQIKLGVGTDNRIGPHFLAAGIGYGGSCFPKDVQALMHMGQQSEMPMTLLSAVHSVNQQQKYIFAQRIVDYLGVNINTSKIAVWGLAFKPGTDDIREAPSLAIIQTLAAKGAQIKAYDPVANGAVSNYFKNYFGDRFQDRIDFGNDALSILENVDMLIVATEWPEFKKIALNDIKSKMKSACIFDGRNVFDPLRMSKAGFVYHSMGRLSV